MKNPFKTGGFDTIIGKGTVVTGTMTLNGTVIIDGDFSGSSINSDQNAVSKPRDTLVVNGTVDVQTVVINGDLIVNGTVVTETLRVEGVLTVKGSAVIKTNRLFYRDLVVEPGAVIMASTTMAHLDHTSSGEQV